jgi:hypothetical protein
MSTEEAAGPPYTTLDHISKRLWDHRVV